MSVPNIPNKQFYPFGNLNPWDMLTDIGGNARDGRISMALPEEERRRLSSLVMDGLNSFVPLTQTNNVIRLPESASTTVEFPVPTDMSGTNVPPRSASPAEPDYLAIQSLNGKKENGIGLLGGLGIAAAAAILLASVG